MSLVLGLDVGGTTTRALVTDLDGTVLARASGQGGNPVAHGAAAVDRVGATVREALTGLDPARVRAGVIGLAGGTGPYAAGFDRLWARLGLGGAPRLVSDVELAFAAGTEHDSGTVLVCGTGAAACRITGGTTARCADGHGWLLGDVGSGVWIGRQAIRHALRAIDLGTASPLAAAVLKQLTGGLAADRAAAGTVIETVHAAPVPTMAALAPVVVRLALQDDPDARGVLARAAGHLLVTLGVVRDPEERTPLVLGGGLLAAGTPLATAVRRQAAVRWPAATITHAGDGAVAAARLARHDLRKALR
ncbi:N-acetylglucosamine kinase [Nonomuraea spiralis]|uniref:N-acetylglucosamine kinase n=1 Tax=Nonomuraea TaxID=83681 RepID=UPI000F7A973D|nr:BadF/BadG/BcrA/BcrD ATPase family protein [Nonomuraea sp. WAC 01424]RSN11485.1 ATPase [Nonomuraea sp. WAC 01424]